MASLRLSRRRVLRGAAAASVTLAAAPFVRARPIQESKLKLAAIGTGNRGAANLAGVLGEDVAFLCDVDEGMLARGIRQVADAGGASPKTYVDWRELLSSEKDLDGVVVSTPDHTHASITRAALRRDLAVYCEKPLARTVAEARGLAALAAEHPVPTQMGIQIHSGANYRRVVEALRAGVIGKVSKVEIVCSKSWSGGSFGEAAPVPSGLNWDLWLGPTPSRPYTSGVHPADWRRFWAFGNGTVGDMACHWLDLVHWALDLGVPTSVSATGPEPDQVGTPEQQTVVWTHGERAFRGEVRVEWWDGGAKPPGAPLRDCHVFHGEKGKLYSTYGSMNVELDDQDEGWASPAPTIDPSPGHYAEWLNAIKGDGPAPLCEFGYSAQLTETVLLANVAYRAQSEIQWDAAKGTCEEGKEFLGAEEREGWEV